MKIRSLPSLLLFSAIALGAGAVACSSGSDATSASTARQQADALATDPIACETSADCCIVQDNCMAVALLVSAKDRETAEQLLASAPAPADGCFGCNAPMVQVTCESHVCVGTQIQYGAFDGGVAASSAGALSANHCGSVPGVTGMAAPRGDLTTQSKWGCGVGF